MINRRELLVTGGKIGALSALPLSFAGCSVNVKSLAQDFIASATAIVNADPSAPYVQDLNEAIQAMQAALTGWNGSGANCALQSAANIAESIIDSIAPGSTVALIAAVAVAGFDVLMSTIAQCTTTAAPAIKLSKAYTADNCRRTPAYAAAKSHIQSAWFPQHAYRSTFNDAAKASGLTVRI